jgi:hypothetical protein
MDQQLRPFYQSLEAGDRRREVAAGEQRRREQQEEAAAGGQKAAAQAARGPQPGGGKGGEGGGEGGKDVGVRSGGDKKPVQGGFDLYRREGVGVAAVGEVGQAAGRRCLAATSPRR